MIDDILKKFQGDDLAFATALWEGVKHNTPVITVCFRENSALSMGFFYFLEDNTYAVRLMATQDLYDSPIIHHITAQITNINKLFFDLLEATKGEFHPMLQCNRASADELLNNNLLVATGNS